MYSEENFLVVKSILELGKPDWDLLRNRKGDWPEDKLLWKQYRSFSMKELKELFIKYGQYKVELEVAAIKGRKDEPDTAIDFVREDSIVAIDRIEDLSSSAIASRYRNVFDMITPPCTEITYMPNRRLKALMSEYGNLTETDEHVLKSELNMRVSCEMQQSWQSPSGGSETNVNDPLLAVFFRQITNLLTDIEQLVIDANRPTNMKLVLANQISQPERVLIYRGNILIGSEAKGADVSDFRTLMQCLQICADACLNLYQQGLESDDCVVPGVITFGESVRMVAVYFLPESYPVIVYLSQSLQICSSTDRMNLARWAVALASFARETLLLLQSAKPRVTEIMYQLKIALFFKPVRNIEKLGGSQVLRPQNNKDVSSARINLDSMMHVYSLLSAVANAQQCILFPLGVITFPLSSFQTDQGTRTSQAPALRNLVLSTVKKYFDLQPADYEHVPIVVFPLMVGSSNEGWRNSRPSRGFVNAYLSRLAEAVRVLNEARVAHMDLRPANIMWRDVASQIISISSNSSSSSSSSSIVGSVEIQIIDFEDAVPFGRCIKHATSYRRHCSYPDFGSQTEYIVAEARHNNFFFNAISAWLLESETIVEFRDFMYKLDSESRSRFSIAPQVLSSEMPVQIEGVSGSNSQVKRKFDHEG